MIRTVGVTWSLWPQLFFLQRRYIEQYYFTSAFFCIFHQLHDLSGPKCEGADLTIAQNFFFGGRGPWTPTTLPLKHEGGPPDPLLTTFWDQPRLLLFWGVGGTLTKYLEKSKRSGRPKRVHLLPQPSRWKYFENTSLHSMNVATETKCSFGANTHVIKYIYFLYEC